MIKSIRINGKKITKEGVYVDSINGLGRAGYNVTIIKPAYTYGSTVSWNKPNGLSFSIGFVVVGATFEEVLQRKDELIKSLGDINYYAGETVDLEFERADDTLLKLPVIGYEVASDIRAKDGLSNRILVKFKSPYNNLYSSYVKEYLVDFYNGGGYSVPFGVPLDMSSGATDFTTMINDGNAPADMTIIYTGTLTDPIVSNETTGQVIMYNGTISGTVTLSTIDMIAYDDTNKNVIYNFVGVEDFWLVSGENKINLVTSSGGDDGTVTIRFQDAYLNV